MKLLRLEIRAFGGLQGLTLDLTDGLNVLCRENGWGKSTLAVFIKAMLYGLPATRTADLDRNERRKYRPWNGGCYGGSLEFESSRGRFRVERVFGEREGRDEFRLFSLPSNEPSSVYGPDLGVALFGIDADGFERSAYLSERSLDTGGENGTVRAKLAGLIEAPDDLGCYDRAAELIDRRRQFYELRGGRGRIADLEQELREATRALEDARADQAEERRVRQELQAVTKTISELEKRLAAQRAARLEEERNNGLRAQERSLQGDIGRKERRLAEITSCFRGGAIPTDAALTENRTRLAQLRAEQRHSPALSEGEQRRIAELTKQFPNGIPSDAALDRADALERVLTEAEARLAQVSARSLFPAAERMRRIGLPSDGELAAASERLAAVERSASVQTKKAARRIPLPIQICLLSLGLLAALLAVLLGLLPLNIPTAPLLGGAAGLAALSLILFVCGRSKGDQAPRPTAAEVVSPVLALLGRYGLHREGGDLHAELAQLVEQTRQTRRELAQAAQVSATRTEQVGRRDRAKQALDEHLHALGLTLRDGDRARALAYLRRDASELTELRRRECALQAQRQAHEETIRALQRDLQGFLSSLCAAPTGKTPEDRLEQIERLCAEHRLLVSELAVKRAELEDFRRENRAALIAPTASVGSDGATEADLRAARERAQVLRDSLLRLQGRTAQLPDLTDRITQLREELDSARASLAVLRKTATYLEEAKAALGTRYLGGMQAAFDRALSRLAALDGLQAVIDPQLTVSLRTDGATHALASASRGTRDLLGFCARLALTEVLSREGETPVLILDDPFISFDEPHLQAALAYLRSLAADTQILYLVCHASRSDKI